MWIPVEGGPVVYLEQDGKPYQLEAMDGVLLPARQGDMWDMFQEAKVDPLALWIAGMREDGTFWAIDTRTGRPMDPKDEAEFALLEARKECPECKKYARSAELDLSVESFCPKHRS